MPRGPPVRHTVFAARAVRSILVDTSTDLRLQALSQGIRRVDAILYTHAHADHGHAGHAPAKKAAQQSKKTIKAIVAIMAGVSSS